MCGGLMKLPIERWSQSSGEVRFCRAVHHNSSCLLVGFSRGKVQSLDPGSLFIIEGRIVWPSSWNRSDFEKTHLYLLTVFKSLRSPICQVPVLRNASMRDISLSLSHKRYLKFCGKCDGGRKFVAKPPRVSEPGWLSKIAKVVKVPLKNVFSKTDADAECLIYAWRRVWPVAVGRS